MSQSRVAPVNSERIVKKMADFEKVVRKHVNDDGMIPADSVPALVQSLTKYVGDNFVSVDRYNTKKALVDELQAKVDAAEKTQTDYNTLKSNFDNYKAEVEAKAVRAEKETAYKEILRKIGIPEKRFAAILKTVDLDALKIADGKFTEEADITKSAKEEWSDFIVTTKETGVDSANPPANTGGKGTRTKEEIMAIKDTTERQRAIAENHELFGF